MKIGELAKVTDCSVQAIRHYEKEGLLVAGQRSEGNFRLYDEAAIEQLLFIKRCRRLDLSISEIRKLLNLRYLGGERCEDANRVIDAHIQQVEVRIQELTGLLQQLKALRSSCSDNRTVEQCGILKKLSTNSNVKK